MADNVTLPGTGAAVRSDDVGGVQVQVVKVALGADGAEDTLIDSGQQTMANSLPVTLASDQSDVKVTLDSEAVVLGAGSAAIGKLAANDGVDIGNVDVASIAAGTNLIGKVSIDQVTANANEVVVKSGTVTAVTAITNALPAGDNNIGNVDLASAIPAGTNNIGDVDVLSVIPGTGATNLGKAEDAGHTSGDVGVMALGVRNEGHDDFSGTDKDYLPIAVDATGDVFANIRHALPSGTNAIGKLAANSGVDIGDVDVTSLPAPLNVSGGGTEATALRVTLASDSTGVVSVDDNGGALTVDGTVTANLSATDNAVLDAIVAALPAALAAGGGLKVEGVAGGVAQPVSIATVPSHAVTNAGTFATQIDGAALTALQLIDNMAVAVDGNYLNVNANIAGTDMVSGSGTATGALRVELPTNGTGVIATVGAVTAITNALPAGTNAIGKLAANSGVDIGDVDILSIAAGTNIIGKVQPFSAMLEGGLTELVGINEQVDQNDYSGSVGVSLGGTYSGEILSVAFYATEDGTGAVQDSAGILYVLDADPSIASGDTAMSAAARVTVIGKIAIGAADWDTDANGGLAYVSNQPIPFHALANLYFVWKHLDATGLNDAAGDDEQLEFNFWWKRES